MLIIKDLTYSLQGKKLFDGASATIPTGHKVGVVGRNGTGKTTFFKLLQNELTMDGGTIEIARGMRFGGVAQEAPASDMTLLDTVLAADIERTELLTEAETATDPMRIADIQTRLMDIGAHSAEARASAILSGLGFNNEAQRRACHEFSGGWRMRVALAAMLFAQPDILLLDEPTNYLDLEGTVWLENFLVKYPHTALIISHDRGLLNRSVGSILHLEHQQLHFYQGKYDQFDAERRQKLMHQMAAKKKQDAHREHLQKFVDRFKAKASKAKQAQSRVKMLEKMQPISAMIEDAVKPFHFPDPEEMAPPLIAIEDGSVGYDGVPVLRGLDLRLDQDDRIALLGSNGEGKSTLSKLFANKLPLLSGHHNKSNKLRIGYFAQHQLDDLVAGENALQHIARYIPNQPQSKLRARLGAAGIGSDIVLNPVEKLSGGQKARLTLTLATLDAPHLLILDEPTNHLDIESREALVMALNDYTGAVILVSHDPHLVESVADRLWLVEDGKVQVYEDDLDAYRRKLLAKRGVAQKSAKPPKEEKKKPEKPKLSQSEHRKAMLDARGEVRKAEMLLDKLEAMQTVVAKKLADPKLYTTADAGVFEDLKRKDIEIKQGINRAEKMWEAAQEKLELLDS